MNSVIDGAMSQTIEFEKSTALFVSFVSTYIHVIAKIETKGIAAKMAPARLLLFPISDIATINSAVMISLVI
jgi:hypothetical protein